MGTNGPDSEPVAPGLSPSQNSLNRNESRSHLQSRLSYIWTTNDSIFSSDVDRWIAGDTGSHTRPNVPQQPRVSGPRAARVPYLPPLPQPSLASSGFWYVAAMVLPLLNLHTRSWRCTPSSLLNAAELMVSHVAGYCSRARSRVRRMASEHGARDIFAGAMDIVLVMYAVGFLLLSLYQATVFQQF